ncbi:MAG TPA: MlaD family protein [Xanthomonadales bacterium]|nr:MlaD family protein [Xanthomonadales bacterium]
MFKGNRNFAVGLFISVALAGVAGFAMWLAGTKGNEPMSRYSMLFEKDVSGLSLGGPVYYLGVNVGRVVSMDLVTGAHVKVRVDIDVLADTPVDSGSYASLMAQGITGVTVVNLAGEPGEHEPLETTPGFEYPLLPVRQTGLSALLADAPQTIVKLNVLLDQANELLGEENRLAIADMLHSIESLTSELATERKTIAALPGKVESLLQEAQTAVGEVTVALQAVQPGLAGTMENIGAASANLEALTQRIDKLLAANEAEFEHFIDQGLGQVPDLVFDLRSTLRDLQKLLQQLRGDPSQLIFRTPDDALEVEP